MTKVSVIQKVNQLLKDALVHNASDIHFEPFEHQFRVRFRIDGELQVHCQLPLIQKDEFIARIKILSDLDIAEKRRPQDGKFSFKAEKHNIDVRVSILPTHFGEKAVLRILDRENIQWDTRSLGLSERNFEKFSGKIRSPYGMILVTGPTGSGKTTTIYSGLNEINSEQTNITTIEDPIEYNLPGINQTHVRADIDFTFATALRSILRQDPDVIMVGEIRDGETANIAIRSALTGHLVLSTLHTNDAPTTITRLINMGIEKFLVASSVKMIIAQRLIRKICTHCKAIYTPDASAMKELGLSPDDTVYSGTGCEHCNNTGYKGRTAVFEIMEITELISNMIVDGASDAKIRQIAREEGMITLREAALEKVIDGITSPQEVLRKIYTTV